MPRATQPKQKAQENGTAPAVEKPPIVPHKVICQVIAAQYDADGDLIGEIAVGEIVLHRKNFGDLAEFVERSWPNVLAQLAQNGET